MRKKHHFSIQTRKIQNLELLVLAVESRMSPQERYPPLLSTLGLSEKKRNEIVTLSQASYDRWQGVNTSLALSKHSPFKNRYFPHIHAWSFRKQRNEIVALSQVSYDR